MKTIDSLSSIGSTSTSITLSTTGFRLIVVPITAAVLCGNAIATKLASEILKIYYLEKTVFQITQFKIPEKCIREFRR